MRSWRGSLLQQRVDRERVADADALSHSVPAGKRDREWPRVSSAVVKSAWASNGKSRPRKRAMGSGSNPEEITPLEVARRNSLGNPVWSFDRDSGFRGTTA